MGSSTEVVVRETAKGVWALVEVATSAYVAGPWATKSKAVKATTGVCYGKCGSCGSRTCTSATCPYFSRGAYAAGVATSRAA